MKNRKPLMIPGPIEFDLDAMVAVSGAGVFLAGGLHPEIKADYFRVGLVSPSAWFVLAL